MRTKDLVKKMMGMMTTRELSEITGYHENSINRWRTGKTDTTFNVLLDLAQACGYELEIKKRKINKKVK